MEKEKLIEFHRFLLNQKIEIEQKVRKQGFDRASMLDFEPGVINRRCRDAHN